MPYLFHIAVTAGKLSYRRREESGGSVMLFLIKWIQHVSNALKKLEAKMTQFLVWFTCCKYRRAPLKLEDYGNRMF